MSSYLLVPPVRGKVTYLHDIGAVRIKRPETFNDVPYGEALICVVANPGFDAALLVQDEEEFQMAADHGDLRPKTWLLMGKQMAEELAGIPKS